MSVESAAVVASKHSFTVAPAIVMQLIKAQCGTLAKAILESIQNSIDAGATKVDIKVDANNIAIQDDGHGFRSREEIDEVFKVFGFDHSKHHRVFGSFGIGRGQMWAYADNIWRTHTFEMRVDVERNGLDYELVEELEPVPGLLITGKFYEPKLTMELLSMERELKELCLYAQVPVTFNGEIISKNPKDEKWDHITDDAYIKTSDSARKLVVYNQGVKVRDYNSWEFGLGGVVVSRHKMSLNMARNDVLVASCAVWKRIRPFLQKKGDEAAKRAKRLSEDQLANMASRFLSGDLDWSDINEVKLISDVLAKKLTIDQFLRKAGETIDRTVTVCEKNEANAVAEASHKGGHCFVLSSLTLRRFGVTTVKELLAKLHEALARAPHMEWVCRHHFGGIAGRALIAEEDWRVACKRLGSGCTEVPASEWTKREKAAVSALQVAGRLVCCVVNSACPSEEVEEGREIRVGVSDVAQAWTDGERVIWFNRETLLKMGNGLAGAVHLVSILLHEYLHGTASTGSHVHDADFFEKFEQAMCYIDESQYMGRGIGQAVEEAIKAYVRACERLGVKGSSAAERAVHATERAQQAA